MKPSERLRLAKAAIDTPEKFTRGASARNKEGKPVPYTDEDAACFCSMGAILKVETERGFLTDDISTYLYRVIEGRGIVAFNDSNTHEQVMQAWDRAIALAESEEAV